MSAHNVAQIVNFLAISDSLGTAGQPLPAQFPDIRQAGYQVVINLAMPDSTNALPHERELVVEQGMDYVHIPVVWEAPTMHDLDRFFEIMERYRDRKIFVHCALNMRVSAFVLLYRVIRLGVSLPEAGRALLTLWTPNAIWQSFIDETLSSYGVRGAVGETA
jgi:protein tyrosine phosphatase (PTP) superfamily phosphohydrolase (DUF442 family)